MEMPPFAVEVWMDRYGKRSRFNLADTCVDCMTLDELLGLGGKEAREQLWNALVYRKQIYGDSIGSPSLRSAIAKRYKGASPGQVMVMNGALSANALVMMTLLRPGDRVIAFHPTFQQLFEFPAMLGAKVDLLPLRPENDFEPDPDELRRMITPETKLLVINNPNNPTGTLYDREMLMQISAIAREAGAFILCDEVYFNLRPEDRETAPSIAEVYERGIATSSLSKTLSLAGIRIGWMTAPSDVIAACKQNHFYMTISCGILYDQIAVHALTHYDRLLERGRALLSRNVDLLRQWAANEPDIEFHPPQGGAAALLRLTNGRNTVAFCKKLLEQTGVLLTPGACFGLDEGYMRVGCAGKTDVLQEGLAHLHWFLHHDA
ncbi:aminotransferase class I/II-fold pyridoxal phosphate-dependent enzyme [Paenibacillus xanthanilyticus]|uniref:Aminotransferase n=1 Tax=Paenibacillus xanthanilyticus TaxID=1783531 RepID=A0ABV8K0B2_9BACL